MKANNRNRTSVAIVGAGPNGAAMANLLGLYGVDTIVVERAPQIVEFPRAVGIDDEALRLFQTAGLADELSRDIIQNVPLRMFKANGECFADIRPSIREFGWWRRNIFMQHLAERTLRDALARYPHVSLRTGEEVVGLEQDDECVTLQVRAADGQQYELDADYVVAADGGRSPVREMLGIRLAGTTHPMKWVVVDVKNARLDQQRYKTLLGQDSISKQQVDTQDALVRQYEGTVKTDQGNVDTARIQLGYTRIVAPTSGRIGLRQVDPGNIVGTSDANGIALITQIQPITVLYTIPEDNLPTVLKKLNAGEKLSVQAWDRQMRNQLADGTLLTTDNQIDTTTGTVKLKAIFENKDGMLFPNQFVNVRTRVDTMQDAVVVPVAAIQRGQQGTFVYVVGDDNAVKVRTVTLGPTDGARTVVLKGVDEGERVVVDGADRLKEGMVVEAVDPAARAAALTPASSARARGRRGNWGGASGAHGAGGASGAHGQHGGASDAAGIAGASGERRRRDADANPNPTTPTPANPAGSVGQRPQQ